MQISASELWFAYRRAKVDAWYEKTSNCALPFAKFERQLGKNLRRIAGEASSGQFGWATTRPGKAVAVPKYSPPPPSPQLAYSSSDAAWDHATAGSNPPAVAFRNIANPTVELYILSSLWIMRVGALLDANLSPACFGNRLRKSLIGSTFGANIYSYSSFKHYIHAYDNWRTSCFDAARELLARKNRSVILTFDIKNYYPSIDVAGLEAAVNARLKTDDDMEVNCALFKAIDALNRQAKTSGLPIGLPASNVLANLALVDVERAASSVAGVIRCSRYVDDFALVIDDARVVDAETALGVLAASAPATFAASSGKGDWATIRTTTPLAEYRASTSKVRLICLEGESGTHLLDAIERNGALVASEWRFLPTDIERPGSSAERLLSIARDSTDRAPLKLRETDGASIRRLGFVLGLRQFEVMLDHVSDTRLQEPLNEFLRLCLEHAVSATNAPEFCIYWKRLFRLVLRSNQAAAANLFFERLDSVMLRLDPQATASPFRQFLQDSLMEAIVGAPVATGVKQAALDRVFRLLGGGLSEHLATLASELFWSDLGYIRLVDGVLSGTEPAADSCRLGRVPMKLSADLGAICRGFARQRTSGSTIEPAQLARRLMLSTRPPRAADLCRLSTACFHDWKLLSQALVSCRGVFPGEDAQTDFTATTKPIAVAVTSFEVSPQQWTAGATGTPDLSLERFERIAKLVVEALRLRPQFIVFPELSIPQRWAALLEDTLADSGISLIAGLEYRLAPNHSVINEATVTLASGPSKFPTWRVLHQAKCRPAVGEYQELERLVPSRTHPVGEFAGASYRHNGMCFAVFICSELTDVALRASLRGNVDAIFAVEYNRDVRSFSAIVEAASLDVHAFVIQCNNRLYGDSRVRGPMVNEFERDFVRLRGGKNDHLVLAHLPVAELRRHQRANRFGNRDEREPARGGFKPTPDGFEPSVRRRYRW